MELRGTRDPARRQDGSALGKSGSVTPTSVFDQSALHFLIVSLVTIKVAGLILIFDPVGLLSFELPKSLFSRALEWLIAGALLIAFVRYGFGIIPRTRMHFAVAALVAVGALSTLFAENRYIALFGEEDHYLGLTFVIDMAVLYLAVAVAFRRPDDWALFGGILAFATALVLAYAAIQYLGRDPVGWNVNSRSSTFSTFGDQDTLGRYISLVVGACVGIAVLGGGWCSGAVRTIAAVLAAAGVMAASLLAVRGTLLGIAAILGALPFVYLRLRGGARRHLAVAAVGSVAIVAALGGLLFLTPVGVRTQTLARDPGTELRLRLFDSALHAFSDRPVLGYGPDNFAAVYPRYRQPGGTTVGILDDDAHNWIFQTLATTGALGLLALLAAIGQSLFELWKFIGRRASPFGGALLLASAGYWVQASTTIASPSLDWFPYLVFGAIATMGDRSRLLAPLVPGGLVVRRALVAVVAIGIAAGASSGVRAFLANRNIAIAAKEASGRPAVAMEAAESALAKDPGRAVYWYWLGRADEAQAAWSAAAAAYAAAATRAPYERAYWGRLAQSLTREAQRTGEQSTASAAIAAARRGTEIDPNEPLAHIALAETAYALGEYDLSLRAAINVIALWPGADNDALVTRAAARASDLREARILLEQALRLRDSAALHLALAQVAFNLGDKETARTQAERTLQLAPENTEARAILRATEK
jgi:O-antigen ligase